MSPPTKVAVAIRFRIEGDLRFLSHRDVMRLFGRALVRARVPARYSAGFNPRIQLTLPLPRPVGVAADDELLVVTLAEPVEPDPVLHALQAQMPAGLTLRSAAVIPAKPVPRPTGAVLRLRLDASACDAVAAAAAARLAQDRIEVERAAPGAHRPKTVDIRPYIRDLVIEGTELILDVAVTPTGSARPRELLEMLGLPANDFLHRLRRTAVVWEYSTPATASPIPIPKPHEPQQGVSH